MKSKAMVLTAFNKPLELREFEIPTLEDGQILVKLEASGVCGSDVHMWKGEDPRTPLPIILGHEGVGRVVDIQGEKLTVEGERLTKGQRILWNRGITCGNCYACKVLCEPSLCENRKVYGINMTCAEVPYLRGCYSEYIILDKNTNIFKLSEDIDPAIMVAASCSGATMAHAFDTIDDNLIGQSVVIQGPGPLGLFATVFAKSLGASQIIIIGGSKERLELCKELGATNVINRHDYDISMRREKIMKLTKGKGADLVIEAVGVKGAASEGITLVRRGGNYILTGYAQPVGEDNIDFYKDVVNKNITIKGIWVSDARHTKQAMDLVSQNKEKFSKIISHRFKLEEANKAIEAMLNKEAIKAVLTF